MHKKSLMTRARTLRGGVLVVGAAALGIGVLAAPASAGGHDWSGVAECESGGNWSINTGNGYYGGLQFSASTWAAYGGTQYAAQANQASKSQQISVAEKVLASQGKGAWPVCGTGLSSAGYSGGSSSSSSNSSSNTSSRSTEEQSASRSTDRPAAKKTVTTPTGKKVKKGDGEYKVVKGDTLSSIAEKHGVKGGWQQLFKLNKGIVEDANLIYPGQQLHLK